MYKTKVLIVRNMALGDVIQTEPIIRAIYQQHGGNCEIDIATRYPDVFKNNPCVNYAGHQIEPSKYNKIINLDWAYELDPAIHIQDAYANVALGQIKDIDGNIHLYPDDNDVEVVKKFLLEQNVTGKVVVVHMRQVGIIDGRNFPLNMWETVIESILNNTDAVIIQVGSGNDLSFNGDSRLINALGLFNIQQLKVLIDYANVFLGSDSAPIHIAYSTDTPIVGLFTTVKSEYREPRNRSAAFEPIQAAIECYGCKEQLPAPNINFVCSRGDVACVERFDPKQIVDSIKKYL